MGEFFLCPSERGLPLNFRHKNWLSQENACKKSTVTQPNEIFTAYPIMRFVPPSIITQTHTLRHDPVLARTSLEYTPMTHPCCGRHSTASPHFRHEFHRISMTRALSLSSIIETLMRISPC